MYSKSNHLEHVLKHIPVAVNNRLQKISSSKKIFKETTQHYQEAIKASRYDHELAYSYIHEKGIEKKKSSILQKRGYRGWEVS